LDRIGLKGETYLTNEKMKDPLHPKSLNLLKGGLVYADALTAVSPTYAKEILTSELGGHLDELLRKNRSKLTGILNGIDQALWNPATDSALQARYSPSDSIQTILAAKRANRSALQKKFTLTANGKPWIGCVTRLVAQKSPELIEEALKTTLKLGGTFLLLGSSPDPKLQDHFEKLKKAYASSKNALLHFEFDESLSRLIFSALDFFILPSLYEPCGLTQLISMRYGTIPIARETGGLKDTVFDFERSKVDYNQRNGLLFPNATQDSMNGALERAFRLFSKPEEMALLITNGMKLDSGWKKSADEYYRLFQKLTR
jgi:ADP-glucose type glycogen/starch synthase